ncbi:MAG TPA: HRDC domain-containing protein [Kofleriaceae bacterium]|nr:HRDC domain-containing protein [Kofleriaceae bacterium]
MSRSATALVDDATGVAEIAAAIAGAGSFAIDLEFVSEDRYVPELALVQVAWGDPAAPEVAAIDPLAVDPRPVFELVADPAIEVVAHAARQDLGLLTTSFAVTARGFVDTQIASSFAGLPDQIGYARMVQHLFGVALDKGPQHTDWRRRPLSDRQLRYALDDVRHLLPAWAELRARLDQRGRLSWAREESLRMSESVARRRPPEEVYRQIGGWVGLKGPALSVLRELAAWREREALASNTPPSWILADPALIELARRPPRDAGELARVRGVNAAARRHADAILAAVAAASGHAVTVDTARPLGARGQAQAAMVTAIVQARCGEADVPVRLVGGRGDAEALVASFEALASGAPQVEGAEGAVPAPTPMLLEGWRHEVAGRHAMAWLRGETALAADPASPGGLRTIELAAEPGADGAPGATRKRT